MKNNSSYRVGGCDVFKVLELEFPIPSNVLYPNQQLTNNSDQEITLSVHSWVVKTAKHTIVIDTGTGNGRERSSSPFFHQLNTQYEHNLHDAGIDPNEVDFVLMTHLHADHVGWNTHWLEGSWVPLFKNARYCCSDIGLANWKKDPTRKTIMQDSINPIIEAGLLDTFNLTEKPIFAEVLQYVATPGHSHDHASIILHSAGEYALFSGDLMHNEIQVSQPNLTSRFCEKAEQAKEQRIWAIEWAADHCATWFSSHFTHSSAGHIMRNKNKFEWHFI